MVIGLKYKVCVYAISKNEEKFAKRFMESVKEADSIYVLDTGSTDKTVEILKEMGAIVSIKEIKPWRFDVARNESLKLVPEDTDICVCLDLDEVMESGWREKLEKAWDKGTTRASYNYNWSFDKYGNPAVNFYIEKIHSRNDYKWTHPVHEVLTYIGKNKEKKVLIEELTVNHYPDDSKSRGSYLPLLELSVKEDPEDDRNMHYLGREYMFYGKYEEAITTLKNHLGLKKATWKDERGASMRFIARCYKYLNNIYEAKKYLEMAIDETPYLREPYVEYGILEYENNNYEKAIFYLEKALTIKKNYKSYINEPFCYNETIYDILSVCYYNLDNLKEALYNVTIALKKAPEDERIKNNKKLIEEKLC